MSLWLHEIAESSHRILDPFTDAHLVELGTVARIGPSTRVLDLACGKGELLCRWAQEFGSQGEGVDISDVFLSAARARADELGVTDQVRFSQGDASGHQAASPVDVACCIGATWIGDGPTGTIELLRRSLRPGGRILIGEPYWRDDPPRQVRDAFGGEQFHDLPGLLDEFTTAGADLVEMVLADEHSWDRYAAAQWWNLRTWLDEHPGDPRTAEVREFLDTTRRAHLQHQRRHLGWGVFVLAP